jgi:hypothetical protein
MTAAGSFGSRRCFHIKEPTMAKTQKPAAPPEDKGEQAAEALVPMTKDGETAEVHPSCVESHKKVGWTLA